MNEKNYEFLSKQLTYAGFGTALATELKENMLQGQPSFSLEHRASFGKEETHSLLHFSKSKESEHYFLNKYELRLKQPDKEQPLSQTFFITGDHDFTLKERVNMLNGRAVYKSFNKMELVGEGTDAKWQRTDQQYKAWADINFRDTDRHGNFLVRKLFWDHEKALEKLPIRELQDPIDRSHLLSSLEKGNLQKVTVINGDDRQRLNLAANPKLKIFDFFTDSGERIALQYILDKTAAEKSLTKEITHDKAAEKRMEPLDIRGKRRPKISNS